MYNWSRPVKYRFENKVNSQTKHHLTIVLELVIDFFYEVYINIVIATNISAVFPSEEPRVCLVKFPCYLEECNLFKLLCFMTSGLFYYIWFVCVLFTYKCSAGLILKQI